MLTVHLVKTYCLPSLLYGCEIWNLNTSDARSVDVAWNNALKKIFEGFLRESVKPLQFYCQCLPVIMLIALRKIQFWKKMFYHDSIVSHILASGCYHSVLAVAARYNISAYHVMHSNNFALKTYFGHTSQPLWRTTHVCNEHITDVGLCCIIDLLFTVL